MLFYSLLDTGNIWRVSFAILHVCVRISDSLSGNQSVFRVVKRGDSDSLWPGCLALTLGQFIVEKAGSGRIDL